MARFGQALADRAPVVILLDDLQWADAASLDVLHYLAGHWGTEGVSVLLLFTARAEDLSKPIANAPPDAPILSNWLTSLGNNLPLTRLSLTPLTLADTQQLLWSMGVGDPDSNTAPSLSPELEAFCRHLFSETRGHPFFIIETLRSLSERGLLQHHESGGWTADWKMALRQWKTTPDFVPTRIQDLIRARLAHLSPQAQMVCTASAVLGQGFDFAQLCQVADLDERDTLPALEALLNRGLLYEINEVYVFVHDTIREVAYTDISQTRRRILHQRAMAYEQTNRELELAALIAQATVHVIPSPVFNLGQGKMLSEQALILAGELGNQAAEAKVLWNLMLVHIYAGDDPHQATQRRRRMLRAVQGLGHTRRPAQRVGLQRPARINCQWEMANCQLSTGNERVKQRV